MVKRHFILFLCISVTLIAESIEDYFGEQTQDEATISSGPDDIPFEWMYGPRLFDLHEMKQDFVLETKRIKIPGHYFAFNASLIEWNGQLLMSFRTYSENRATNDIGLILLDENCDPVGAPQILAPSFGDPFCHQKRQDPRLIRIQNRLFIVYNNHLKTIADREIRRMLAAEVFFDGEQFSVGQSDIFLDFEGESPAKTEKNWVPFEYEGELMFSYSVNPHRVLHPIFGTQFCESVADTRFTANWDWGGLRGGSQAIKIGDEYLSFFHCSRNMPSSHSKGKTILHYFMGAYTFSATPPFEVIRMSPEPVIGDHFYDGPAYKTWKPLRVVFPCGLAIQGDTLWISYGKQDHEVWVAKIDTHKLLNSLIPVHR